MRGTYGLNWKPGKGANGKYEIENYTIDHFLGQISHLKTVDYIQLHLNESSIYSPKLKSHILGRYQLWEKGILTNPTFPPTIYKNYFWTATMAKLMAELKKIKLYN